MKKLQRWFEVLAGVDQNELTRLHIALDVYTAPRTDLSPLEKPACWRRPRRIRYGC